MDAEPICDRCRKFRDRGDPAVIGYELVEGGIWGVVHIVIGEAGLERPIDCHSLNGTPLFRARSGQFLPNPMDPLVLTPVLSNGVGPANDGEESSRGVAEPLKVGEHERVHAKAGR